MKAKIVNVIICLIFAGIRIYGNKSSSFQAFAHLYDGALIWEGYRGIEQVGPSIFGRRISFYGYLGWALALVELTMFLIGRN